MAAARGLFGLACSILLTLVTSATGQDAQVKVVACPECTVNAATTVKCSMDPKNCAMCAAQGGKPGVSASASAAPAGGWHLSQSTRVTVYEVEPAAVAVQVQSSGNLWKDHVAAFDACFNGSPASINPGEGVRRDYRACEAIAAGLEVCADTLLSLHEDSLRKYGNPFHNNLELLAINAHRLRIACAEQNPANIEIYWYQLGIVHALLARTQPWQ